jgi:hypothetical protein
MAKDMQYDVAKLLLEQTERYGFVLSGGRALTELGLGERPTKDLDVFTAKFDSAVFEQAVNTILAVLPTEGYRVSLDKMTDTFARIAVLKDGQTVTVDLGYDYREYEPIRLDVGIVLNEKDAILNKVSALYSRSLPRDFIDIYSIRKAQKMSDSDVLALSQERDEGFILEFFLEALRKIRQLTYKDFVEYKITHHDYENIVQSTLDWADEIEQMITT